MRCNLDGMILTCPSSQAMRREIAVSPSQDTSVFKVYRSVKWHGQNSHTLISSVSCTSPPFRLHLTPQHSEFLGANVPDNKPFIVTRYLQDGNVRFYVEKNPDCDRLKLVRWNLLIYLCADHEILVAAVWCIFWFGVSSLEEDHPRWSQWGN